METLVAFLEQQPLLTLFLVIGLGDSVAYPFGFIAPILLMYFANVWLERKVMTPAGGALADLWCSPPSSRRATTPTSPTR